MTQSARKPPAPPKRGFLEYLLLGVLLVVVAVTGWTLWDNGLVDTVAALIGSLR